MFTKESELKKLGLFTISQAQELGVSHQKLSMLVKQGTLLRMDRGLYLHHEADIKREIDFQVALAKFGPTSAIGGLSALFYYNLVEQVPNQTWILVPPTKKTTSKGYRLIRTKTRLDHGIVEGDGYRIVSVERAIVEACKLASKIGERTTIKAARTAIQEKMTTLAKLGKMAKELGLEKSLNKYLEAIIGAVQ